jgi:amino acid adenylation domain-containing protein
MKSTDLSKAKNALLEKYLQGNLLKEIRKATSIPKRAPGSLVPLSFGQEQIWFFSQLAADVPLYNESLIVHMPGPLNVSVLEQSFNECIRRHEIWRTSFPLVDGSPVQMVHPALTFELPVTDLRHLPQAEREAKAIQLATEKALPLFDLTQIPLLRPTLIRLDDEDHRLYLTIHHMLFDGTIYEVFLSELHTLYQAFLKGEASPLPPLPIQYADFAVWQRQRLQGDLLDEQMAYWKKQLAGAPTTLELPSDRPYSQLQTYRGARFPFTLTEDLTNAIKALSRREGVTLYTVLVATFLLLLHRYNGQEDLLVGTTTSGRNHPNVQPLIGLFLNTLVLRTDLSGNPTFRELLGRVREVILDAHAHQDVPFEYLVRELQPDRNIRQNPLIQVIVSLEPPLPVLPTGWTMTLSGVEVKTAKFDLYLELDDRPDGFEAWLEYNTDLFDESTIIRMAEHWQCILASVVIDPTQHLTEIPLLTDKERHQLLVEWNSTTTDYPHDYCLHQLFEAQVAQTPDRDAVVFAGQSLTYRELNAKANQLAHYLRRSGVGPETLVGIYVERSLDMLIALLGVLKAGGAYVPLDPTYPHERIAFMLDDARVQILITQRQFVETLPLHGVTTVCMDTDWKNIELESTRNPINRMTPQNLAYVIYTSGSTGRPKGVQIQHSSVVNFLASMRQQPGITSGDTLLAVTTLSFDIAALELFLPLVVGARVVIAPRDSVINGAALAETIDHVGATMMQATPITWRLLLAAGWQGKRDLKVLCGGEALPLELAQQLLPKVCELWNMYGPTETTIWSTLCKIEQEDTLITVGRPIANTELYILDKDLQLVPIGVPGELYIGGVGLAREYLFRPELSREKFIPHPFKTESGARLYKTGDLARYRADGRVELMGRLDNQVKLRGFRIELKEIESVLSSHPAVQQAVVIMREDTPGDKRLVAYVALSDGKQPAIENELQHHLMKQVPPYMVPSAFVLLESFPLTPNGKVDRRSLPLPDHVRQIPEESFAAPTLMAHYQLINIWEDLLQIRPIGIRDNFFRMGGHSLLAARMINQFEQVSGKRIPLSTLFAGPTIEQLVNALQQEEKPSRYPLVAVQANGSRKPFFFLHGDWTRGAFYCFTLADALERDQPFYVLEPYRGDGVEIPTTLEDMAAAHLASLRTLQPEGPYLLGGFCNGGVLAYELARQLRAEGQRVDLLVLINPTPPAYFKWLRDVVNCLGGVMGFSHDRRANWFLRLRHALRHLYRKLHASNDVRVQDFEQLKQVDPRLDAMFPPVEALRKDYIGVFTWLVAAYFPGHYSSKITFFWASEEPAIRKAWRKVSEATEIEICDVPGTHMTCITEHIHTLAEHLRVCLEKAHGAQDKSYFP